MIPIHFFSYSTFPLLFFTFTQASDEAPGQASGWRRGCRERDQGTSVLPLDWLGPSWETGDPGALQTQNCQLNRWTTDSTFFLSFCLLSFLWLSSPSLLSFSSLSLSLRGHSEGIEAVTFFHLFPLSQTPTLSLISLHASSLSRPQCVGHFIPCSSQMFKWPCPSLPLPQSPLFSLFHHLCWFPETGFERSGTDRPVIIDRTLWPWGPAYSSHMQMYVIISLPHTGLQPHWPMVRCALSELSMLRG